jgi:hypothetical protein
LNAATLSVVCIVIGYPVIGSMGIVTFDLLAWGDHRSGRWPDAGVVTQPPCSSASAESARHARADGSGRVRLRR